MTSCSNVVGYHCFEGSSYLCLQGEVNCAGKEGIHIHKEYGGGVESVWGNMKWGQVVTPEWYR